MACCATTSGLRFILFPPLIVHSLRDVCQPYFVSVGRKAGSSSYCVLSDIDRRMGCRTACSEAALSRPDAEWYAGILVLRILRVHMPPALAVGLLPLIIDCPSVKYPVSVTIGTGALTLAFLVYRWWITRRGAAGRRECLDEHKEWTVSNTQLTAMYSCPASASWPGPIAGLFIRQAAPTQSGWRNPGRRRAGSRAARPAAFDGAHVQQRQAPGQHPDVCLLVRPAVADVCFRRRDAAAIRPGGAAHRGLAHHRGHRHPVPAGAGSSGPI